MMMRFYKTLIAASGLVCLTLTTVSAQQQTSYFQYMYNTLAINPAYAGYYLDPVFNVSARSQFQGFEGAPKSAMFSVHGQALDARTGLGATFLTDRIGATSVNGVYGSYAYKLISKNRNTYTNWEFVPHVLSLGIQAGFAYYREDLTSLGALNDPHFSNDITSFVPNVGFGIYYSKNTFVASFSVPQLIGGKAGTDSKNLNMKRHIYLSAGNKFTLGSSVLLDVTTLTKYVSGSPLQVDVNGIFTINKKFNAGIGYSSFSTMNFMVGLEPGASFRVGYFYGHPIQDNLNNLGGSHEFLLSYRIIRQRG